MRLSIDTSDSDKVVVAIGEEKFESQSRHKKSQMLLSFIQRVLRKKRISFKEISEIDVETGPGSFTGLRVGVAIANCIGWVLNIPVNGKNIKSGETVDINYE